MPVHTLILLLFHRADKEGDVEQIPLASRELLRCSTSLVPREVLSLLENCPPLPVFAVQALAAIEAPAHCCEIEGEQEYDEDEYNHGLFFLSYFFCIQFYKRVFQHILGSWCPTK